MNPNPLEFAHEAAVDIYGDFLDECVVARVAEDRVDPAPKESTTKIDERPVRLVTISGKGGWSPDAALAGRWKRNDNISLVDHALSVARGALMFCLADAIRPWSGESDMDEAKRVGYAVVCIAFLHDIDKDLGLARGAPIDAAAVGERMSRYGIDCFLARHGVRISPDAMRNYIEDVEASQTAKTIAADDYDRNIAAACRFVGEADKLDGIFTDNAPDGGVEGVVHRLETSVALRRETGLTHWKPVEIHDHIHVFLLDEFQRALSSACRCEAGCLPLIEVVHDGRLLCLIPRDRAEAIEDRALEDFLSALPYGLRFEINNRLACKFVGGAASWRDCKRVAAGAGDWGRCANLLALPREFARERRAEIDALFEVAGMETTWSPLDAAGATAKPALEFPGGDAGELDSEPAHALAFLVLALNHQDAKGRDAAPDAGVRERELRDTMIARGLHPPAVVEAAPSKDGGRARRVLLALWAVGEIWRLAERDLDGAQDFFDDVLGESGLAGLWIDGADGRPGLAAGIADLSGEILQALRKRFTAHLSGRPAAQFDTGPRAKHCILCNEPVAAARRVDSGSRAHGVKVSAFSGRDGRNDHLAAAAGDTHLCPVCLAELQLRHAADAPGRGGGYLPPLVSSPIALGLFGGLAYERESLQDLSLGLHDLNRLDIKKGQVYRGLDCQTHRIRVARLEKLPERDVELIAWLHMTLRAARRLGRPIHIFRGAPRRHPAIFHFDAMPAWLERLLGGNALRIEQIPAALDKLELFQSLADLPGLGIEWARQLADPKTKTELGALCVAWAHTQDRTESAGKERARAIVRLETRKRALDLLGTHGEREMKLRDNPDPLVRLAWLATRIQKRLGIGDSTNKQLLCWKLATDYLPKACRSASTDPDALVLGIAGTLEGELTRKSDAANRKHRDGQSLSEACIDFARHFFDAVWVDIFREREPTSRERRRAASIYRFALLEAYRERGISETQDEDTGEGEDAEGKPGEPELEL